MVLLILLGASIAFVAVVLLHNAFLSGTTSIPGPVAAKFSNVWRIWQVYHNRLNNELSRLHQKHGKYVRVGPNVVSITDVKAIDHVFGVRTDFPRSDAVKPNQPIFNGKLVPTMLSAQDGRTHGAVRKPVAHFYATSTVMSYEPFLNNTVELFFKRLDELFIKTGASCPIDQWIQYFAYDVITTMTIGKPFGFLQKGGDLDGSLAALDSEFLYRGYAALMPVVDWIVRRNPIRRYLNPTQTSHFAAKASTLMRERLEQGESDEKGRSRTDFISRFLKAKEKNPDFITDRHVIGWSQTNLVAGSDTTALVMRTALYYSMKNPDIIARVRKELDDESVVYPVTYETVYHKLPYCAALIREALRYVPAASGLLERAVPPRGYELPNGQRLPGGTIVGFPTGTINRDREIFGADADEFNPQRWLRRTDESSEEFEERLKHMKAADLSFSRGSRACLGKHIAELEMFKVIPTMFGLLDVQLTHPEKDWTIRSIFFNKQSDIDIQISWREGKSMDDLQT